MKVTELGCVNPETTIPDYSRLRRQSNQLRLSAMTMTNHSSLGHTGGDLSASDILATLYLGGILQVDPQQPTWSQRDRFIMSKGHCSGAFYSVLAARGFFPRKMLETFMDPLSRLNGHPDRNKLPGIEANTGPLGHGFPIAVGCALACRMRGESWRTFVLTGDGELQEGSNWEAAMSANHYGLDNLVLIVDRNRIQQGDFTESTIQMDPLAPKFTAFGFAVAELDGHDHAALFETLSKVPVHPGKPTCIIANTVKAKGISFGENIPAWHHGVPTLAQLDLASAELGLAHRADTEVIL